MNELQEKPNKLWLLVGGILIGIIIILFSDKILSAFHMYDYTEQNTSISIKMTEEKHKKSYGREMRIVSVCADGEILDLSKYANADWVWHEEWGYVLYQEGDSEFVINLDKPVHSFELEYVKQEGSGNAVVYCNNEEICKLNMYERTWKNKILTLSYVSKINKYFWCLDVFLLSILLLVIFLKLINIIVLSQTKLKGVKSNLTMFDLAKGTGIIFIILGHTKELIYSGSFGNGIRIELITGIIGLFFLYGLMPMFFIASGYGFRISEARSTCKKQLYFLLKPYAIVALATLIISLLRLIISTEYGFKDFLWMVLPFLFANVHEGNIGTIAINSIGPMWFGFALGIAWIILNYILNLKNKKIQSVLLIFIMIIGYIFSKFDLYYYSLTQIVAVLWFIFVGYNIREKKIFTKEKKETVVVYLVCAIFFVILAVINGLELNIAMNNWGSNYIIGMLLCTISGIIILRLFLEFNQYAIGKFKLIKEIGRNTYIIFYVHAFEYLAIPWKNIVELLPNNKIIQFIVIVIMRAGVIYLIYKVVELVKKRNYKRSQ